MTTPVRFRASQTALNRKRRDIYLTDAEWKAVQALIQSMRLKLKAKQ